MRVKMQEMTESRTFGCVVHRLVELSLPPVVELYRRRVPLAQALGAAWIQDAHLWREHIMGSIRAELKVEQMAGAETRWGSLDWMATPREPRGGTGGADGTGRADDTGGTGEADGTGGIGWTGGTGRAYGTDRCGLNVYKEHPRSWHLEYMPAEDCADRTADLVHKMSTIEQNLHVCHPAPQRLADGLTHPVRRCVCFRTRCQTRLPEKCALDWDAQYMQVGAPPPLPFTFPQMKRTRGLVYPKSAIPLCKACVSMPGFGGIGYLYMEDPAGHWDEWEFCSLVQVKIRVDDREDMERDLDCSLVLNALEGALDEPDCFTNERRTHLHTLLTSLNTQHTQHIQHIQQAQHNQYNPHIQHIEQNQYNPHIQHIQHIEHIQQIEQIPFIEDEAFTLRTFLATRSTADLRLLEEVVNAYDQYMPQEEETLNSVLAALHEITIEE